jgi:hypothetical protein
MASGYEPKSIMGYVFGAASSLASLPVGIINGTIHAADGGSFGEGFENGAAATIEIGAEFGDKHGGKIVRKLVTGILFGLGADIAEDLF